MDGISVVKKHVIIMLIGILSIFGLCLFSSDVIKSYIQSLEKLERRSLINPTKEFNLKKRELFELLKPLNGLSESGDYWGRSFKYHLKKESRMESIIFDTALFYKPWGDKLIWICANYVDDTPPCMPLLN